MNRIDNRTSEARMSLALLLMAAWLLLRLATGDLRALGRAVLRR